MEQKKWSLQIGGRELVIETGLLAKQANGAVTVRYGDTVVLATATMSKGASRISGYFPLMVDYEERYYAAGKIKGSRFIKREGRPSDDAVLTGRVVDRTIRPLFDARMRNEVQVVITVLSIDGENDPDIVSMIAASAALTLSNIPWNGPIGAVRVGRLKGDLILNPVNGELADGDMDLILSGTKDKINMIEAGIKEVSEADVVAAFEFGFDAIKKISSFIEDIRKEVGKEKAVPALLAAEPEFEAKVKEILLANNLAEALYDKNKHVIEGKLKDIKGVVENYIDENYTEGKDRLKEVAEQVFEEVSDEIVHENVLQNGQRPDGRKLDEIRHIDCKVGVLPRTHGTGLFTRGETQALTVTTLGSPGDEQIIDTMEIDTKKRYIHHYNFPPFSVGEVRPMRGPGRREIGHGALAERALIPVIPPKEEFPYTILLVSEILESNGSSSMASTCGSTLSLMDAGVPIIRPVSGIAMGIIIGKDGSYKVLTDIQGLEDHYGDMDFKVAGTEKGITALQMDVKVDGITVEMLRDVLVQSNGNRKTILEKMLSTLPVPRKEMSQYAPRIITMHINPEKIRNVIGTGGKIINEIIDSTGVEIDIEDDGSIFITSPDALAAQKAQEWIKNLTHEVKAGEIFNAKITRLMNFGAFAEILPGQEGLIHISQFSDQRVEKVEDVCKIGDILPVKVIEIDSQGRINLSAKAATKIMQ
ncbi:MAG: Polyribonucleotide nucleotidyltransferase [Candidatus Moranbacteria bacterium GW2011_GWE1_49_15]|nr:MAG: Polyribonucleotide nucleotidyltransferase [Candidatus Moranbacteria bacterium GW2011_GWE2_47_10]KKW07332.1 MAG: Polyribonucleotide nucleotidyltransferase [Candidatus Moranbacteria bacterium GW2011_GWE1_49_15]HBP00843.1 polyribonucleotide nucleotidyltransferase [Candidatus Moranbacteria bacterium]